jgi:hypothetical protein
MYCYFRSFHFIFITYITFTYCTYSITVFVVIVIRKWSCKQIRCYRKATRFDPKAWIISTWNQPSWLCSIYSRPSWKRRWEKGWVSSIISQYSGMCTYTMAIVNFWRRSARSFCLYLWTASIRRWSHILSKRMFLFPIDKSLPIGRLEYALVPLWRSQISQVVTDIAPSVTTLVFWLLILFS